MGGVASSSKPQTPDRGRAAVLKDYCNLCSRLRLVEGGIHASLRFVWTPLHLVGVSSSHFPPVSGFVIGDADLYDSLTGELADRLDMVLVSLEYRLAPEAPFPAG